MQVQAPATDAQAGFVPVGGSNGTGLFNAFYEATSPIAFDFASGLTPDNRDVAAIVAASYEDVQRDHETTGAPYHVVPLLTRVYAASSRFPRPPARATRPGLDAVGMLGEPHRSILHLTERHRFSAENTAAIVGLDTAEVVEAREDARAVAHGVSAALALCPGGVPACPGLAAELDPARSTLEQTERILDHAERCDSCLQAALASPDPIRALRGAAPTAAAPAPAPRIGPAPSAHAVGTAPGMPLGAGAVPLSAMAGGAAAGASPLPGPIPVPAPSLVSKAAPAKSRSWSPLRLWSNASGWQRSGAVMAVLLIAALVVAIATGSEEDDVAARTNGSVTAQSSAPSTRGPSPAGGPSTTTTTPITTSPVVSGSQGQTSTTFPVSGSSSASGSSGSYSQPSPTPAATVPPQQVPETTAPPTTAQPGPEVTSQSWGTSRYTALVPNTPPTREIDFDFVSTGTSVTYTTSWGQTGNLLAGEGTLVLTGVPLGAQTLTLTITGPSGTSTKAFVTPIL
ncbi:MAG: hypothetical protein K1X95_01635 [Acidimicrobiia bacterium]|nr:hypothetical protein [Acidimicrobiia bacterium]